MSDEVATLSDSATAIEDISTNDPPRIDGISRQLCRAWLKHKYLGLGEACVDTECKRKHLIDCAAGKLYKDYSFKGLNPKQRKLITSMVEKEATIYSANKLTAASEHTAGTSLISSSSWPILSSTSMSESSIDDCNNRDIETTTGDRLVVGPTKRRRVDDVLMQFQPNKHENSPASTFTMTRAEESYDHDYSDTGDGSNGANSACVVGCDVEDEEECSTTMSMQITASSVSKKIFPSSSSSSSMPMEVTLAAAPVIFPSQSFKMQRSGRLGPVKKLYNFERSGASVKSSARTISRGTLTCAIGEGGARSAAAAGDLPLARKTIRSKLRQHK